MMTVCTTNKFLSQFVLTFGEVRRYVHLKAILVNQMVLLEGDLLEDARVVFSVGDTLMIGKRVIEISEEHFREPGMKKNVTVIFPVTFQYDASTFDMTEEAWAALSVEDKQDKIKDHADYLMETGSVKPVIHGADDEELIE